MNASEVAYIKTLEYEISRLKEQVEWFQKQVFGKKSEKYVDVSNEDQLCLDGFEKSETLPLEGKVNVPEHVRVKRRAKGSDTLTLPDNIPVEKTILDIPEEQKVCSSGKPLIKIGEEVTRKLAHKPGSYYVKEIIRLKYSLSGGEGILAPELPSSLLPKCRADESLLAEIMVKKFSDHLPLYRIAEDFSRNGISISRQLLSKWVVDAGLALEPLYLVMKKKILESGNVFVDETPVDLLMPGKGKAHQGYMWVLAGGKSQDPPYRIYDFRKNRKHENAFDILKDFKGAFHSDKYGAYVTIAKRNDVTWCPCWSHIRRKFIELESGDPKFRKWVLRKIRYLFMLERVAWNRSPEERIKIRLEKEVPIIDELIKAVKDRLHQGKILPKSKFKEALGYFHSLIPYLKNYTKSPFARLDNNVAERAVRPLAIGRKNWMFFGSERGGKAGAIILSLVQTCRGLKINPREYLEDILRRIMDHPFNNLHELLPDAWLKDREKSHQ